MPVYPSNIGVPQQAGAALCPSLWEMAPQLTNGTGIQVPLVERGATTWQNCAKWHR